MQDPPSRIFFRILRERELQSLREYVNHVLSALWRALVVQIHEQAQFECRFKKPVYASAKVWASPSFAASWRIT
jgi:hypothetical protein